MPPPQSGVGFHTLIIGSLNHLQLAERLYITDRADEIIWKRGLQN